MGQPPEKSKLAMAPICSMCPVNCRSGMAFNCTVTGCFAASRPRSVSSTRAEIRSVVASGNSAMAAPGHARSPGRYAPCSNPTSVATGLWFRPKARAKSFASKRVPLAPRHISAFLLACSLLSIVAWFRVWSDFCLVSASRSFCSASASFSLASSPSILETISCLPASRLAACTS